MQACSLAQERAHERGGFLRYFGLKWALWATHWRWDETQKSVWQKYLNFSHSGNRLCPEAVYQWRMEAGKILACVTPKWTPTLPLGGWRTGCDVFTLHISCVECDTAPARGETRQTERRTGNGATTSAFRWWGLLKFQTTAWLFLRVSLIEIAGFGLKSSSGSPSALPLSCPAMCSCFVLWFAGSLLASRGIITSTTASLLYLKAILTLSS